MVRVLEGLLQRRSLLLLEGVLQHRDLLLEYLQCVCKIRH